MPLNPFALFPRPLARSGRKAPAMSHPLAPHVPAPPPAHPSAAGGRDGGDRTADVLDAVTRLAEQARSLIDAFQQHAAAPAPAGAGSAFPAGPAAVAFSPSSPVAAGYRSPATYPAPATGYSLVAPPYPGGAYGPAAAADAPAVTAVPAGDVRAVVADLFRQHQAAAARSAARGAYARDHLADLPAAYRRLLPDADDPAALADAEQAIRAQYRDDLRAALRPGGAGGGAASGTVPPPPPPPPPAGGGGGLTGDVFGDVGGDRPGGDPPAAAVDYAKLSPLQQIAVGLRGAVPARPDPRAAAAVPGATARSSATSPAPADDAADEDEPLFVGAD